MKRQIRRGIRSKAALAVGGDGIMNLSTLGRWTVRSLQVAALTAGLAGAASTAFAQINALPVANTGAGPKRTFTKNTTFNLPIQMDERVRATLSQVQLFV